MWPIQNSTGWTLMESSLPRLYVCIIIIILCYGMLIGSGLNVNRWQTLRGLATGSGAQRQRYPLFELTLVLVVDDDVCECKRIFPWDAMPYEWLHRKSRTQQNIEAVVQARTSVWQLWRKQVGVSEESWHKVKPNTLYEINRYLLTKDKSLTSQSIFGSKYAHWMPSNRNGPARVLLTFRYKLSYYSSNLKANTNESKDTSWVWCALTIWKQIFIFCCQWILPSQNHLNASPVLVISSSWSILVMSTGRTEVRKRHHHQNISDPR